MFWKDSSKLFDLMVTDCWAHDHKNFKLSKYIVHLNEQQSVYRHRMIDEWTRGDFSDKNLRRFVFATLPAFKLPDKDQLYFKCDIEVSFIILFQSFH